MNPSIDLAATLLLVGSAQAFFFMLALLTTNTENYNANRYLAVLLALLGITLIDEFMTWTHYYLSYPHLLGLIWPTNYLYAPFAYFYVKSLTSMHKYRPGKRMLLHLIPFALDVLYNLPKYLMTADQKVDLMFRSERVSIAHFLEPDTLGPIIQMLFYLIISVHLLNVHARSIKDRYSSIERINLIWLRNLLIALFALWCMYLFAELISPLFGVVFQAWYALHVIVVVVIFALGFFGVRQPVIFAGVRARIQEGAQSGISDGKSDRSAQIEPGVGGKYRKSTLDDALRRAILEELRGLMAAQRPYLDGDLALHKLADMMGISPNHLSEVINANLNMNFFDFINSYRVEEAKRELARETTGRVQNVLTIALEAGFNSKSAFYTAFKKHTDMTPSQFRKAASSG
jgi:AraC-like DNA-binding protein